MKLGHLNLATTDPPASAAFLAEYFGLRNEGGKRGFMVVRDDDGMVITLMKAARVDWPGTFHIGFYPGSEAEVDALHSRMVAAGHEILHGPAREHGYTFYVAAPGGFTVEVTA